MDRGCWLRYIDEQSALPVPVGSMDRCILDADAYEERGVGRALRSSKREVSPERRRIV